MENAVSNFLIPAITKRSCSSSGRHVLDGLRITNPCHEANREDQSSVKVTMPSIEKIVPKHMRRPKLSCEMITLRNKSYGKIIICMGIFTTSLRNIKIQSNTQ